MSSFKDKHFTFCLTNDFLKLNIAMKSNLRIIQFYYFFLSKKNSAMFFVPIKLLAGEKPWTVLFQ